MQASRLLVMGLVTILGLASSNAGAAEKDCFPWSDHPAWKPAIILGTFALATGWEDADNGQNRIYFTSGVGWQGRWFEPRVYLPHPRTDCTFWLWKRYLKPHGAHDFAAAGVIGDVGLTPGGALAFGIGPNARWRFLEFGLKWEWAVPIRRDAHIEKPQGLCFRCAVHFWKHLSMAIQASEYGGMVGLESRI